MTSSGERSPASVDGGSGAVVCDGAAAVRLSHTGGTPMNMCLALGIASLVRHLEWLRLSGRAQHGIRYLRSPAERTVWPRARGGVQPGESHIGSCAVRRADGVHLQEPSVLRQSRRAPVQPPGRKRAQRHRQPAASRHPPALCHPSGCAPLHSLPPPHFLPMPMPTPPSLLFLEQHGAGWGDAEACQ